MYYAKVPLFQDFSVYVSSSDRGISGLFFSEDSLLKTMGKQIVTYNEEHEYVAEAKKQLMEYANKQREKFDLPLDIKGTSFQRQVWDALIEIPYGETWSYKDVAIFINNPKAIRAVGQANRRNNLPIILPCHRVIGQNLELTGYAGTKVHIKERLLRLEGISVQNGKVVSF
ncbi:methylated-DNA--[protein]-cysteine S-methyltransferase [Priestia megaterium]|nr:methylated-DNA--[protein]-cysteine S-methyltransferase [Priestia megaterium]